MKLSNKSSILAALPVGVVFGLLGLLGLVSCSTAPSTEQEKSELHSASSESLRQAEANDPSFAELIKKSAGYAIFPSIGKGAVGIGGAYGKGDLYEKGVLVGYCDMTQGTIGFQLGGQSYTEIVVFETAEAVQIFKSGHLQFDAQATAVALKSGAGANAKYANGVCVFTMNESGLMYEASIGGQQFTYQPI